MTVKAGQALYGERNKGHALLARSPAATVAADIVNLMDIQGTVPPGISWGPYWSGQIHDGFYVLSRTAADHTAARPGMVRSRALIVELDKIVNLDAIGSAFAALSELPDHESALDDIELGEQTPSLQGHAGLANALLSAGEGPVIWALEDDIATAIAALWWQLWPAVRTKLSFGFAFGPQDLGERQPTIIVTPESLIGRWAGFRIVTADDLPVDAAAAFLVGDPAGVPLAALMRTLDARLSRIDDLPRLAEVAAAIEGIADIAVGIDALRLISFLSPEPDSGVEPKRQLLNQCIASFPGASIVAVRMARNLDLTAIPDPAPFWKALSAWAAMTLWENDTGSIAQLLTEARGEAPAPSWREAIWRGVEDRFALHDTGTASLLWKIFAQSPTLLYPILAKSRSLEASLADVVPVRLKADVAAPLLAAAAGKYPQLHGALAAASLPPKEAILRHLKAGATNGASVARALARANKKTLVGLGATIEDVHVRTLAADVATDNPSLLAPLDITNSGWRALWEAVIRRNPAAWAGPRRPHVAFRWIINAHHDGDPVVLALMEVLANSPLADLSEQPDRAVLWPLLDGPIRERLLAATGRGWITRFLGGQIDRPAEFELAARLAGYPCRDELLKGVAHDIALGCRLFRCIPNLDEASFLGWARGAMAAARLDEDAVDTLGRLIATRSWSDGASLIAELVIDGRDDLRPALTYCIEMLGLFTQYRLDMWFEKSPAVAKWRTLEELGAELYGIGPGEHGLWERAGGKKADIPIAASGRDAWRRVVSDMERGRGRISTRKLVEAMIGDFPHNLTLRKMRQDDFFQ